jgi:rubrerythrin
MAIDILRERGTPLEKQAFDWRDLVQQPISKLDNDAFTRVRVILMNGIESEALRFGHLCARMNRPLQLPLARVRRVEQHQQTMVRWLLGADHSPLETTIGYEQVAIEVTASLAEHEPDPYLKQAFEFGLLEDLDHLYRFAALMDRVEGMDANSILQCYTDIRPGRPTSMEHRAPEDALRECYERAQTAPISKLHARTLVAGEYQTLDYYTAVGPTFADPVARSLFAEIASVEEQHVTEYESLIDPDETWLEKWVLNEANEVYNYWSCYAQETDARIKKVWERFLDYELGHLHEAVRLFQKVEKRDAAEILPGRLPEPIDYSSHRDYVKRVLERQVSLRTSGTRFVPEAQESRASVEHRARLNASGSPSETVAAGYRWAPGTEVTRSSARKAPKQEARP